MKKHIFPIGLLAATLLVTVCTSCRTTNPDPVEEPTAEMQTSDFVNITAAVLRSVVTMTAVDGIGGSGMEKMRITLSKNR